MRKILYVCLFLTLLLSCTNKTEAASPVSVKKNMVLEINNNGKSTVYGSEKIKLKKSKKIKIKKVTYKIENRKIATVDSKGVVYAKKPGTTKLNIIVKYKSGKKTKTVKLPVCIKVKKTKHKIALDHAEMTVKAGEVFTLKLEYAEYQHINWAINDAWVIDFKKAKANMVWITANHAGNAKITAKCNGKKYVCYVTVVED